MSFGEGQIVSVLGVFFGDEGKAKIVDYISKDFDYVVRYQGGDNAGHTVWIKDKKYVFQLIPCGILQTKAFISHGVVLNPQSLLKEIQNLSTCIEIKDRLFISEHAHVICDWNIAYDKFIEHLRGSNAIGTTNKGIGPTYSNKALRLGIRVKDLLDYDSLREKIDLNLKIYNVLFKSYGQPTFDLEVETRKYFEYGQKIKPYLVDSYHWIYGELSRGKKFLFEGSQGLMLDLDLGTYPFVTSSNITGSLISGTSLSFRHFKRMVGVVKVYSSRVGNGEFITEIKDLDLVDYIRKVGNEFGSVTGRPRKIGWLDLVALKYVVNISGITEIVLTLVDVLNNLEEVKVCDSYEHSSGQPIPMYKSFKGWKEDYSSIKRYSDFSEEFRHFVKYIEDFVGIPVTIISYGKSREDTLIRMNEN
ncbi:adenylosuccinate synthetase [Mycoplasma haemocanis str. Illinois]|uniref:Adenylosuccinate synthetase n=1 Tax=Mycoplasma haemocanis (strain Illinois) TaxID=1111676 RepID=H6N8K3_MYCHN|nr:adenylosuccinate synthase [Mycoplasma haemocanis]AEW45975.1 adenylosuccinate synthetase [Mycoplasma haemocanis str. Illinois]